MKTLTLAYSTHRLETLAKTSALMAKHDVIILEEPPHPDFHAVLTGNCTLADYLLEFEVAYPKFTTEQYNLLRQLHGQGKVVVQIEPYLEMLLEVQFYLADDHRPEELDRTSQHYAVYCHEREATGTLIDYYRAVRGEDFDKILATMQAFTRADAARFLLRDGLRASQIVAHLQQGSSIYVEAGSIHLSLHTRIRKELGPDWRFKIRFVEQELLLELGESGSLYSPGDELTLAYLFAKPLIASQQRLLCAQSLIFAKLITKHELPDTAGNYPHIRDELETIRMVKQLSFASCKMLFFQIRTLSTAEAGTVVREYLNAPVLR